MKKKLSKEALEKLKEWQQLYSIKNIQKLDPREHVRRRPGMYIGGTDNLALHHMIFEVIDSSLDSVLDDKCDHIALTLKPDNWVTIKDNDTIFPNQLATDTGTWKEYSQIDRLVYLVGNAGPKWATKYNVEGGLHGVGLQAVNSLSTEFTTTIRHNDTIWKRTYREGLPYTPQQKYQSTTHEPDGVEITFQPDFTIFDANDFDYDLIAQRCRDIAYTVPHLTIELEDQRETPIRHETFHYSDGLKALVRDLNRNKNSIQGIIHHADEIELRDRNDKPYPVYIEIALQFTDSHEIVERAYVNTLATELAGTHINALRSVIQSQISDYLASNENPSLFIDWSKISRGLTLAISIRHPDPRTMNTMRFQLMNPEVFGAVADFANTRLNLAHDPLLTRHFNGLMGR